MFGQIGEFHVMPGKMQGEWRIPDFFSPPEQNYQTYTSSEFLFAGACWKVGMDLKGQLGKESGKCIEMYLERHDTGCPMTLRISFGIRKADGGEEILCCEYRETFHTDLKMRGDLKFLKWSDLMSHRSNLSPSGTLTVTCNLRSELQYSMEASLFQRLWNLSSCMNYIMNSRQGHDVVVLKLKDGEISALKMILQTRSPVFDRMFEIDMRECQTSEVNLMDDIEAFKVALRYAYSGVPDGLRSKNVCEIFKISHKYQMEELTKLCRKFMHESLSVDIVCDVIVLAEVYQEKELKGSAKGYFVNNAARIVKTEKWKALKRENPAVVSELLECIIVENASKIKIY